MEKIKRNCFAYKEHDNKPECNALKCLDCENCKFFKDKHEIKNNIFYEESFISHHEFIKALEKYSNKYGIGHLEEFEEDDDIDNKE